MENASKSSIVERYKEFINKHVQNVVEHIDEEFLEINQIAEKLNISHVHLTDTIQRETGHHPCYFYDFKIIEVAKQMLLKENTPIAEIARRLTYDPSNFSKFFKKFTGYTPGNFRKQNMK